MSQQPNEIQSLSHKIVQAGENPQTSSWALTTLVANAQQTAAHLLLLQKAMQSGQNPQTCLSALKAISQNINQAVTQALSGPQFGEISYQQQSSQNWGGDPSQSFEGKMRVGGNGQGQVYAGS